MAATSTPLLRRSVFGSVRSASPFSTTSSDHADTPRVTITPSSRDRISAQNERSTPTVLRRRATGSPMNGSLRVVSEDLLAKRAREGRPPTPEYDRKTDLVAEQSLPDREQVEILFPPHSSSHPLFGLPAGVKQCIYSFCFPPESRHVTLSPKFATKAVFPDRYFASPWDIIEAIAGGIQSFHALRYDLLTYFWSKYHFHATLSDFSGPKFSPLSHVWLLGYLDVVQHLTIEIDCTRFGCSQMSDAASFGHKMEKTERIFAALMKGLAERPPKAPMVELHLMCRRYAGCRFVKTPESATVQYCPDSVFSICDTLIALRGHVTRCRVSGFSEEWSRKTLLVLFADVKLFDIIHVSNAWPADPDTLAVPSAQLTPASIVSMDCGLTLHHTRSFAEDFEDELSKYSSPSSESNYTFCPGVAPEGEEGTLPDHVQRYQELLPAALSASIPTLASTPRFAHLGIDRTTPDLLTPTLPEPSSKTPNKMNELNEQDPAFIRTVNAMRSLDLRRQAMIAAPKTPDKSDSPGGGTKRKYMSFVNRLRGCVDI